MSYYDASSDILYSESELADDVIGLVDLFRHGAYAIKSGSQNPFHIRGHPVTLNKRKGVYSFFANEWANKREVSGLVNSEERGLEISDVHLAALMYGMRQNFFVVEDAGRHVGWYLDPVVVYCGTLPAVFDDFEEAYSRAGGSAGNGSLALQSRNNDFLGKVALTFSRFMETNYAADAPPFKKVRVTPSPP